ncbi:MAG: hypothetical protein KAT15_16430, partial [Bacteroidales bacterium]|nr:hypothetical protein [Bacteroidales bacterium]
MSFAGAYLEKAGLDPLIVRQTPRPELSVVVAIPVCNEPDLLQCLQSLKKCTSPVGDVEILIALNSSEAAPAEVLIQNTLSENEIREFARVHSNEKFR